MEHTLDANEWSVGNSVFETGMIVFVLPLLLLIGCASRGGSSS